MGTVGKEFGKVATLASVSIISYMYGKYKNQKEQENKDIESNIKANKADKIVKDHKPLTNSIIALMALGISMAKIDGDIVEEERNTIHDVVGGLSHGSYPKHLTQQIEKLYDNPPTFNEAMKYLENVESVEYKEIRNLLVMTMEADGIVKKEEKAFLEAFDKKVKELQSK